MATQEGFEWFWNFQAASTLEGQLGLTAAILILAVIIAKLVAPAFVQTAETLFNRALRWEDLRSGIETIRRYSPWWTSLRMVVHILQFFVVGLTVIALLAVWGQLELARAFLGYASLSTPVLIPLSGTVLLFVAAIVVMDLLETWLSNLTERSEQFSRHQEEVAFRVMQIIVVIATGLIALSLWNVDLGGVLIGAGFLGIVAGMAAQQTLGSLIAGFVLMFSRPFEIGDWVQIGENEGIVTEITIVNTRLENFDGEFVVLPNDKVGNATIINRSQKGRLRLRVEVGVDYEADPDRAQEIGIEALKGVDEILTVPRPQAITKQLGDSAVVLELRFWIDKPSARRRARATSAAIRAVKSAYREAGIKIPFPQRELAGREETGGFRVLDGEGSVEE